MIWHLWRRKAAAVAKQAALLETFPNQLGYTALPGGPEQPNAIQTVLDQIEFPFRASCQTLIDTYGLERDKAFGRESVLITPCPFGLTGLIGSFSPNILGANFRHETPLWFGAMVSIGDDMLANLEHARAQLSAHFGPTQISKTSSNTLGCGWQAGPSSLTLTVWPAQWQTFPVRNDAHSRDPRLKTACSVGLSAGFRRALDAAEITWLVSAVPIAKVLGNPARTLDALWGSSPNGAERTFVREPVKACTTLLGRIALSGDEAALIICSRQLYIVPRSRITGLVLQNILPAKGGGGSWLSISYLGPNAQEQQLPVSELYGQEQSLDALAQDLGTALALDVRIEPERYDC
ncbi:hypothetical protein [Pelagibacterium sp.]|uniref:hypothetical protein n=1 Tax=Pelagibacterium sp. TaxID=1967288 RepID=UPI003A90EF53